MRTDHLDSWPETRVPFALLHGFWLLDDLLNVEVLHTALVTRDPQDVRIYDDYFDAMWGYAAEGAEATAILTRLAARNAVR
ncbi:hypothetical protein [Amycolatopsis sp. H20-H5]|uniref:hypothetical protein n=1 Tax=Amycolatopsis sp. H20-H5 TaxID=3046309 RepID=UPI002DB73EBB|nr:hypothetical protein [Amycolatopsis sp. H20-H5]MEC3980187.1 hypothetical protein [Amycolatopsis sp. H20-H5]